MQSIFRAVGSDRPAGRSCTGPNGAQRRGACGRRNLDADRDIRGIVPGPRCGTGGAAAGRSTTAPPDIAAGRTPIRRTVQRDRRWLRRPRRPGGHLAQVRRLAAAHRGFDLPRLAALPEREAGPLARYASAIRSQREDDDRDALTMREQDPRSVAVVHDRPVGDLTEMLVTWRCRGRLDGRETRKGSPPAPDGCRSVRAGPAIADRGTGIPSTVCPSEAVKDSRLSGDFDSPTSG